MTTEQIKPDGNGWRQLPGGNRVHLGLRVQIGDGVRIGDGAEIGNYARIGDGAEIGDGVRIGDRVTIPPRASVLRTPFSIVGSRHPVTILGNQILIGCRSHTLAEWRDGGEDLAYAESYTPEQIEEYRRYLDVCEFVMQREARAK